VTAVVADTLLAPSKRQHFRRAGLALAAMTLVTAYAIVAARVLGADPLGALGVFAAATVSSIAGFAFSALCAPLLAQLDIDAVRMVQTMAMCSIAIQVWAVWALRRNLDLAALAPLLAGGVCALPAGVLLLMHLPEGGYAAPVGAVVLAYGLWALFRPPVRLRRPAGWRSNLLIGATGGITGGLAAFPGAVVAVWCGLHGWPKERQRAVTQTYILVMQIALLGLIGAMAPARGAGAGIDLAMLAFVPPALLGAVCGLRLFAGLTDRQFARAVNILLVVAGFSMMV